MRIFAAGIATETNTFAPIPTGAAAYAEHGVHRGSDPAVWPRNEYSPMFDTLARLAEADGQELIVGLGAYAMPGGITRREVWETLRDELLQRLHDALPVDAVILPLHGAMLAEGCDSCESDLVERVRAIVGPGVAIGVELDLHCHFTETLRTQADVVVAYKHYPHTDIAERLEEVWRLTLAATRGRIRPVMRAFDCRMVGCWHTTREPMLGFVQRMASFEGQGGVLSVSFGHGFEYADVPEAGAKIWVVSDERIDVGGRHAAVLAEQLGREVFALRELTRPVRCPIDEALDAVLEAPPGRPLVLADGADNPGGGASGDSSFILRRVVERGLGGLVLGGFWDPAAVQICREAGAGATLSLRVGGKSGPASGAPVDLRVSVRAVHDEHRQTGLGAVHDCGPSAWVRSEAGVDLVLISKRQQVLGLDLFTGLGVSLHGQRAIVVKSAQHFHDAFAPIAQRVIYVSAPGLMRDDVENLPYRRRSLDFWPRVEDPWRADRA